MNGHSLDLGAVLQMVPTLEAEVGKLYLVGCEPAALETEEGRIGLSAEVSAAIGQALGMIFSLVQDIQEGDSQSNQGRDLIAA
jgi:hydrogenase maturation protease